MERMRVLDMSHYWSRGTHSKYQGKLIVFRQFEVDFGVPICRPTPLLQPPAVVIIGLMWMIESYSLRTTRLKDTDDLRPLSNATVWQLRSALSQYIAWDTMFSQLSSYFDKDKCLIYQACRPTDALGCSLFATGIASPIGKDINPSVALLDGHVRSLMMDLEDQYLSAKTPRAWRRAAQGGLATLVVWLGWLGSFETFHLSWRNFNVVEPANGPSADLPLGCGAINLCLGLETNASCH
jgi:hypothetical protein